MLLSQCWRICAFTCFLCLLILLHCLQWCRSCWTLSWSRKVIEMMLRFRALLTWILAEIWDKLPKVLLLLWLSCRAQNYVLRKWEKNCSVSFLNVYYFGFVILIFVILAISKAPAGFSSLDVTFTINRYQLTGFLSKYTR